MAIESPKYTLVKRDNKFEVRDYGEYIAAEIDVEAGFSDALNTGFGILAGYIFGGNSAGSSIAMTAPVSETSSPKSERIPMTKPVSAYLKQDQVYTVSFSMPRKYTLDTLPRPNDKNITIRIIPASRVAVLKYSGSLNEKLAANKTSELMAWLKQNNITPKSTATSSQYNPPWIPGPFRTNEVMVNI